MDEAAVVAGGNAQSSSWLSTLTQRWRVLSNVKKVAVLTALAAFIALLVAVSLLGQKPSYRILFANLPDKDGGAIVQTLQQMNVPYQVEVGGAISVPADKVYDVRLKLAAQGLPKSGGVGFELMENQKFGTSQFGEQVNYQRAVEGELGRSVESLASVASARVHIAFPKQTVFLREQQKPTASVLVSLHPGRMLDRTQVNAIIHLVAASIPELTTNNVTVVDQEGNLLSKLPDYANTVLLNQRQMQYVQQIEEVLTKRVETILTPIVGPGNVKAEVTAAVDFSEVEQTSESFKPNTPPNPGSIRSTQSSESSGASAPTVAGVPGALSNQPPGAATAPINLPSPPGVETNPAGASRSHKESTTNYELDKTIQHVKQPVGIIKKVSAAVVVNYRLRPDKSGKISPVAMTQQEMNQINNLVKEAVGFSESRGDAVSVVNASFAGNDDITIQPTLLEKIVAYVMAHLADIIKLALLSIALIYLVFGVVRPVMRDLLKPKPSKVEVGHEFDLLMGVTEGEEVDEEAEAQSEEDAAKSAAFADLLQQAKEYAKNDPRMAATIIREWLANEDEKK